ncbi:enoyl-CoA hydratase/isomerase family protein [Candidatus Methanoperedens nitratireducens]|uniref:Enoyl-CoA hydratase-isomerase n=1 Tax=Candidatus Methanoperedens nitratireducens TaxID=1392998 RepID=A0A284VQD9_9EURY|nr:enoyl-CoA hydratase-related protein [Candidatus Methanoperedens nitroreducens]SNQ61510.1 enoyl-CoA hydratase-isomerase [Candidatus Methanoperedens nitroreducens]
MTTGERIKVERNEEISIIILNRPHIMNALDAKMFQELRDALTGLGKDNRTKVIIITGGINFCAGADINELKEMSPVEAEVFSRLGHDVFDLLENTGKPVIAAINGYALGGGCELALACDIRIAGDGAKFGQPEVNLGLIPGFGATQRLTRLVGIGWAKELILSGRTIDVIEAESIGLVNSVVDDDKVMDKAAVTAKVLAQKSPLSIKMAKTLINKNPDIKKGLEVETISFSECFASDDHVEGINAFLEKRRPKFKGI